jgi:hypothetical protein
VRLRHTGLLAERDPHLARRQTRGDGLVGRAAAEFAEDEVGQQRLTVGAAELVGDGALELAELLGSFVSECREGETEGRPAERGASS